jgi:hypothetical protein
MRGWKPAALLITLLYTLAGPVALSEEQFDVQKIELIKKTASDICNTVKEAKGRKRETQTQAEVQARISGLAAKLVDIGGGVKALRGEEEFEGLSREATALGLQGDRECRERLFTKMFDKLGSVSSEKSNTSLVQPKPPTQQRNPAQAAEQLMRLTAELWERGPKDTESTDDIIRRLHVPFCADIILSNADDLRLYLESIDSDHELGRKIVSVVDTQLISQVDFRDLRWIMHNDAAKQRIAQCLRNGIASPLDHMVTVCVRMVDLHKEVLAEVIVDRQSNLIKSVAVSATPACAKQ